MPSFSQIFATEHAAHQATVARLPECLPALERISDAILTALRSGRKILFFGNGGSAADAQHLAAEFVIRYRTNRVSLPAIALTTDSSVLTACGNDFGFDTVFARQVEGIAQAGDVVIGITTSGSSKNVVAGLEMAKSKGCVTVAFVGEKEGGGKAAALCDHAFLAPSEITARVQECHLLIGHMLCERVDQEWLQ